MRISRHLFSSILAFSFVMASLPAVAQVVTATLPSAANTFSAAVNATTNKTYVANFVCSSSVCPGPGTVTVINGANNSTASVTVGVYPYALAVNATTNKIFVGNACGNDVNCNSLGTVTVIDGATNNTTTVTVGYYPYSLAVNATTNKIYVGNLCGNDPSCSSPGTVTVIDANNNYSTSTVGVGVEPNAVAVDPATDFIYVADANCFGYPACAGEGMVTAINGSNNSTQTINVGANPLFLAVNATTNKIYVSNDCGNDATCSSAGTVTVIDGATNNTTMVNVGFYPQAIAINPVTNQTYVANNCSNNTCSSAGSATVINGNSNYSTTTVPTAYHPVYLDIDTGANKIYVANTCGNDPTCSSPGTLTVIDGATNSTFPIAVGDEPNVLAANSTTHNVYVPNFIDNTISVVGGQTKLQLESVTPCRLVDTRSGSPIQGGTFATFNLPQLNQNCPSLNLSTAAAYSLNVTLVPANGRVRYLTIWPAAESQPGVSLMNSLDGRTKADAAIVPAGVSGGVSVYVTDTANVILDIDGYFAPSSGSTLQFFPLTPCRVADTRSNQYPQGLGQPHLSGGMARDFPVTTSSCIPSGVTVAAYSFNLTAIAYPGQGNPLGYLEIWPTGSEPANPVSTLNNPTGTNVANAAIVPAGTGGDVTVYASANTDLAIDINGYFASTGSGGLSLYPTAPCRVIDTRNIGSGQPFSGTLNPPVDVVDSACGVPSVADAYVFNATVIPVPKLPYLTLWPDGEPQPGVSTLNAGDGFVTSNMAVVPNHDSDGKVDAYAQGTTQLVLDISSYFAP